MNYVAVQASRLPGRAKQLAIRFVLLCGENEGNIVDAVSRREPQTVVGRVVQQIGAGLAKVRIDSRNVDSMIVVPTGAARLEVWVVIVLTFTRLCDIFRPAIPGCTLLAMWLEPVCRQDDCE